MQRPTDPLEGVEGLQAVTNVTVTRRARPPTTGLRRIRCWKVASGQRRGADAPHVVQARTGRGEGWQGSGRPAAGDSPQPVVNGCRFRSPCHSWPAASWAAYDGCSPFRRLSVESPVRLRDLGRSDGLIFWSQMFGSARKRILNWWPSSARGGRSRDERQKTEQGRVDRATASGGESGASVSAQVRASAWPDPPGLARSRVCRPSPTRRGVPRRTTTSVFCSSTHQLRLFGKYCPRSTGRSSSNTIKWAANKGLMVRNSPFYYLWGYRLGRYVQMRLP